MGLVAGIDAGTQSLKVLVYDPQAQAVAAVTSAPLTLDSGADGSREQAPADWVSALRDCFAVIDPRCALASSHWRYRGSSMGSCRLMMLARYWRRPSCGATPAPRPNASRSWTPWADSNGPSRWRATRSRRLHSVQAALTRIHRADAYARLATILLPHDYLNFVLTGQRFCELGDASGTGWLDVRTRTWSQELLRATDPDRDLAACLPPIAAPDALFDIAPKAAAALGLQRR